MTRHMSQQHAVNNVSQHSMLRVLCEGMILVSYCVVIFLIFLYVWLSYLVFLWFYFSFLMSMRAFRAIRHAWHGDVMHSMCHPYTISILLLVYLLFSLFPFFELIFNHFLSLTA